MDADGNHCVKIMRRKKVKERCKKVIDVGGGVYHKLSSDGIHTHTLQNFVSGKQL